METTPFDPTAPLPGPPDPWASTDTPSRRDGPPFHMTEMIAAEPALAERILARHAGADSAAANLAARIMDAIAAGSPVVFTGCGTSEHGALAAAEILREAAGLGSPLVWSAQAFELSLDPPTGGLVIGITHEGATIATNAALEASRAAGADTAVITVTDRSPAATFASVVVGTGELDQSWCHTVGYVSPIVAATAIAGHIAGARVDGAAARALLAGGLTHEATTAAEALAMRLAGLDRLLVLGSGADRHAGRELVLKIEEGTWLPAAYRDLETFLHGHLAATDRTTGIVVLASDRRARDARAARIRGALAAANVIGMPTAAIVSPGYDVLLPAATTTAGRIVVAEASEDVPAAVGALLSTATALQTLTERLARVRRVDPDPIHRDVDRYREAADAAG
ncbi:MAG TPA: SIS domain-containing protein [Candidatus Saccharimonadales bacterium]|nr:SIS domain-containing protein [Candidatus Saccharimonadales bacterium]